MKKKIFAVALAATMVAGSAMSAFAATAESFNGTVFAENTGDETLTGDFNITYKFNNATSGTDNWDNFIIEFYSDSVSTGDSGKGYLTVRADAYGWWAEGWLDASVEGQTDVNANWAGTPDDEWANWMATMANADCTVNAVRSGNTISLTYDIVGANGTTYKFTNSIENKGGFTDTMYVHLTAEECALTGITFTNNSGAAPAETKAPADETKAPADETKAPAQNETQASAPQTGDATNVAIFALVAVAACGAVVATRKKVTE